MSEPVTNLLDQLKRDEGQVLTVYLDSRGIRTAGVGHNLEAHGIDWPVGTLITQEQSDEWLQQDIAAATSSLLVKLPWTAALDDARKGVLQNMTFNMGIGSLLGFHHTLTLIETGEYVQASESMLQSLWAREVGARATRLSEQMATGQWV